VSLNGREGGLPSLGARLNRSADRLRPCCPNLGALAAMDVAFVSTFEQTAFRLCMWPIKAAFLLGHAVSSGRRLLRGRSGGG